MFQLNITKKAFDGKVEKTITAPNGIEMTVCVQKDAQFESALANVQTMLSQSAKVTRDSLKRGNQGDLGGHEAMLFVIGEYCISDWNIELDGEKMPISGENLLTVLEHGFSEGLVDFITDLMNAFADCTRDYAEKASDIQKKPLRSTAGKDKDSN